ncbi:hypothetical protein HispidOSU_018991, partial [Sigmodon hispidus]
VLRYLRKRFISMAIHLTDPGVPSTALHHCIYSSELCPSSSKPFLRNPMAVLMIQSITDNLFTPCALPSFSISDNGMKRLHSY